jgi:hypothetical protein
MMRVYWVERISPAACLAIAWAQLRHCQTARIVSYEETAPRKWAQCILRLARIEQFEAMPEALGDLVNDAGVNLYWHNDELMLRAHQQAVSDLHIEKVAQVSDIAPDILRAFLGRAVLADMYQASTRTTALWGNARLGSGRTHVILLKRSIFAPTFSSAYSSDTISTQVALPGPDWFRLAYELLALGKAWLRTWRRNGECTPAAKPCVAFQYTAGLDCSRISDIPWLESSGLSPEEILVNCTAARLGEAMSSPGNAGFRFADINQEQPGARPTWYRAGLNAALRAALAILTDDSLGLLSRRIWLAGWIVAFLRSRMRWESFFYRNSVRLHLHVGDADALALTATDALNRSGGIDLAYQLGGSCIELVMEHRALTGRLLFCWGEFHRKMYRTIETRLPGKAPRYIILSGHQHDYLANRHRDAAIAFRRQLHDRGIRQVIVAFDNVARRDFLISPGDVNEFYDCLLKLAESDSTLAVVVKPKTRECAAFIAASGDRRAPLQAAGRWIELPPETPTMAAALHGDVAVALHMGTAAMEAGIVGVPHIYYDNTAWSPHPFYRHARHLVATDCDRLKQLLAEHRVSPNWEATEEGRSYRYDLSPFTDGRSNERMGSAIATLFAGLEAGTPVNDLINSIKSTV